MQGKYSIEYQWLLSSVISQPRPCISSPIFWLHYLSLLLFLFLSVCDWLRGLMTHQRQGKQDYKTSVLPLFRHTDDLAPYWASLNGYLTAIQPRHHSYQLQPATMCKGLASLPTCCLERYMKPHANTSSADVKGFWLLDLQEHSCCFVLMQCICTWAF